MPGDTRDNEDRAQDDEDRTEASHEPRECMACRGTGQVISNLGGTASNVTCPWCRGGGVRIAGIDAQASWLEAEGEGKGAGTDSPTEPAA
jgi:DnaJ-class molecular chaperone